MSVVLYSILIRRYNDISSKADRGDIFIRTAAGSQKCPQQGFIVVPPSNIMEVKNKTPNIGVKIELK